MKKLYFTLPLFLVSSLIFTEKVTILSELMKPVSMAVDDTQLYVTEGASIYIYSLNGFKLIKKFGKQGQGPQEFALHPRVQISVDASTDDLIINSLGKLSFFTKDGVFKNEIKAMPNFFGFQPLSDKYLGLGQAFEENVLYNTVNIFDANLKKIKEIYRMDSGLRGPGKGIRVLQKPFLYQGYEDRIFLPGDNDSSIDVYDSSMKKLFTVKVNCEKLRVTPDFKEKVIHYLKTSSRTKDIYEALLKPVYFPDYFPIIQAFFVVDKKIYVMTWKREKEKNEFYIYDMMGKFLKKQWITLVYQSELEPYPVTVRNGKLYQLIENLDNEEWELHITRI